jgi:hypothetical protein
MKTTTWIQIAAIGLVAVSIARAADELTKAVTEELTKQCLDSAGYQSCVAALRYHGLGKDDDAMEILLSGAPSHAAKEHYKIAQSKPKDGFWKIVASAGSKKVDCTKDLEDALKEHFKLSAKALSDAADDSAKNNFLGLSDLLATPQDAPKYWPDMANEYRFCFYDFDNLFNVVKKTLGRGKE